MNVGQIRYYEVEDDKFVQRFETLKEARGAATPAATIYAVEKTVIRARKRIQISIIKDVVKR